MAKKPPMRPESRVLDKNALELAVKKIDRRIADLQVFDIDSINDQFDAKASALLDKINASVAEIFGHGTVEYNKYSIWSLKAGGISAVSEWGGPSIGQIRGEFKQGIDDAITHLNGLKETLEERLQDISATPETASAESDVGEVTALRVVGRRVFIVHGHDEAAQESTARLVSKLGLEPVILHEQLNKGRTIIEKLEDHLDVDYVIVLLTPDDVAAPASAPRETQHRARQNVILELGLFIGALGRARVCALYKAGVEIPSDYSGVLFIKMDEGDGWKFNVAKEMKGAGLSVDLNKL
jgi:predicted nucleotide-binding protein